MTHHLNTTIDLHFDDYTAVMYENAENNLKSVPEQQRFYGRKLLTTVELILDDSCLFVYL